MPQICFGVFEITILELFYTLLLRKGLTKEKQIELKVQVEKLPCNYFAIRLQRHQILLVQRALLNKKAKWSTS